MNILIASHAFSPSIGGIETVSLQLAKEFIQLGHEVRVVTQTLAGSVTDNEGLAVLRRPDAPALVEALKWCSVFWQNNLGIRTLWPLAFIKRPVVITHAGSYCQEPSGASIKLRLKHALVNQLPSVAISNYVAGCFKTQSFVIPNPYDCDLFKVTTPDSQRSHELVFLGRLANEKGADILLRALGLLSETGVRPTLSIIGSGPEHAPLQALRDELGLKNQVRFEGPMRGAALVDALNKHKIMVLPTRSNEAFGVAALEGIACGCVVVGSSGGGLPDTIGPCGVTFPNEDSHALASAIANLLADKQKIQNMRKQAGQHLAKFHPRKVAESYLEVFQKVTLR